VNYVGGRSWREDGWVIDMRTVGLDDGYSGLEAMSAALERPIFLASVILSGKHRCHCDGLISLLLATSRLYFAHKDLYILLLRCIIILEAAVLLTRAR
jgi:hypothetical protein